MKFNSSINLCMHLYTYSYIYIYIFIYISLWLFMAHIYWCWPTHDTLDIFPFVHHNVFPTCGNMILLEAYGKKEPYFLWIFGAPNLFFVLECDGRWSSEETYSKYLEGRECQACHWVDQVKEGVISQQGQDFTLISTQVWGRAS